jgi:ribosome-associated heat shock protein Hsp15
MKVESEEESAVRLDKWLWAARFFKTRALASEAIKGGKVEINGNKAKPSHHVQIGELISLTSPSGAYTVIVLGVSSKRGPASIAKSLFDETEKSREKREELATRHRLSRSIAPSERPNTQDRRAIRRLKEDQSE